MTNYTLLKCITVLIGIIALVCTYGIYAFTHPSINGIALSAVIGGLAYMVGSVLNKVKDLENRSK